MDIVSKTSGKVPNHSETGHSYWESNLYQRSWDENENAWNESLSQKFWQQHVKARKWKRFKAFLRLWNSKTKLINVYWSPVKVSGGLCLPEYDSRWRVIQLNIGDKSEYWWYKWILVIQVNIGDTSGYWWYKWILVIQVNIGEYWWILVIQVNIGEYWWYKWILVIKVNIGDTSEYWWYN